MASSPERPLRGARNSTPVVRGLLLAIFVCVLAPVCFLIGRHVGKPEEQPPCPQKEGELPAQQAAFQAPRSARPIRTHHVADTPRAAAPTHKFADQRTLQAMRRYAASAAAKTIGIEQIIGRIDPYLKGMVETIGTIDPLLFTGIRADFETTICEGTRTSEFDLLLFGRLVKMLPAIGRCLGRHPMDWLVQHRHARMCFRSHR